MAYDEEKVNFSAEEHAAAKNADEIYEELKGMLADGLDLTDLTKIPGLIPPSVELYKWLASEDRAEFAGKLLSLATMLSRDNEFL